jgi:hypothetical protein
MPADQVFTQLKKILIDSTKNVSVALTVVHDREDHFYLDTVKLGKNKKPSFFGAVQVKKSYVAFHLMPVYTKPTLLDDISGELKARMQGKSCFNFSSNEPTLFKELGKLVKAGVKSYEAEGLI